MTASFTPDHAGVGRMLRSDFMMEVVEKKAEGIKTRAEAQAPVDEHGPHPGRYRASFHVRAHSRGGAKNDRAEAVVYNDAPEAIYVEFGHWGREPYATLRKAAYEARL